MPAAARRSGVSSVCVRPGPSQPTGRLPGKAFDDVERVLDHRFLVRLFMDRALLIGMAHEFPGVVFRFLRDARVIFADARVECERRPDILALEQIEEAPHADPHAVFMPAPVRHVGQMRHPGRGREHLARHRFADIPDFEIDDGPEHDARAVRQFQRRTIDDCRIVAAFARQHGLWPAVFLRPLCHSRSLPHAGLAGRHVKTVKIHVPIGAKTICRQAWRGQLRCAFLREPDCAITTALGCAESHCSLRRTAHLWNQHAGDRLSSQPLKYLLLIPPFADFYHARLRCFQARSAR